MRGRGSRSGLVGQFIRVWGAWGAGVVMALGLLSAAPDAHAQDARERARTLYAEAQALFDRGQYPQAEQQFRAAYAAVPNPVVLKAIAASQERQGNTAGAVATLQQYLQASPSAPDRAEVEARIQELAGAPATMTFNSTPPGAQILLDGADSGQRTPATLQIASGEHQLELRLDGYGPHRQAFTAQPRSRARLDITMSVGGSGDAFGTGGDGVAGSSGGGGGPADPSVAVWVVAGVAALGLVSGTVFGFLALSEQSNFDATPTNEIADRGETFALVADISFGVAAAAAITAIVLYIVEATSSSNDTALLEDEDLRLDLGGWADAQSGGVAAQLAF